MFMFRLCRGEHYPNKGSRILVNKPEVAKNVIIFPLS